MSDSLQPDGLSHPPLTMGLGKNTGVGCHFLLPGFEATSLALAGGSSTTSAAWEALFAQVLACKTFNQIKPTENE